MKIPEIDPSEVEHLSSEDVEGMGEEELKHYVHELEVKPYVSEGAVKILKAEGAEELGNDGKAVLIDARPKRITVAEPLELSSLSSSSYYCRSKLEREDRYAEARSAIKEEFEFVRGIYGCRCIHHRLPEREEPSVSRARRWALMAEEGCSGIDFGSLDCPVVLQVNGMECSFTQELVNNDQVVIRRETPRT